MQDVTITIPKTPANMPVLNTDAWTFVQSIAYVLANDRHFNASMRGSRQGARIEGKFRIGEPGEPLKPGDQVTLSAEDAVVLREAYEAPTLPDGRSCGWSPFVVPAKLFQPYQDALETKP